VHLENVTGSAYNDSLSGDAAANALKGESGNDVLNGGAGADVIEGGRGLDRLDGGTGNDTLSYLGSSAGVTINLATGLATGGDASGDRFSGFENVAGSSYDDNLTGDAGANALSGENGNDALNGGLGSDIITGGNGRDTMTGGGNADRFVFTAIDQSVVGSNRDVITDFNENEDLIDLSAIDAIPTTGLDDSFTFIGTDAFTAAGQVRYQISGGQTIIQVNQDGTLSPDMEIALTGTHVLDSADFIL
jgi:serralysin